MRHIMKTEEDVKFLQNLSLLNKEDIVNGLFEFLTFERLGASEDKNKFISSLQRYLIKYPDRQVDDWPEWLLNF